MPLTKGQEIAFNEIVTIFREGALRARLVGSAGTGKTYLSKALAEYFITHRSPIDRRHNNQVFITAPTNKALAVLMAKYGDMPCQFRTIHSALRKQLHTDNKTGERKFIRTPFYGDDISQNFDYAKFCIIDESSMLEAEIEGTENIEGDLASLPFPILYIGDKKQLPPVGEPESPVFIKPYPEVELTEIIRQGAGNPIIDLSRDLDLIYFKKPKILPGETTITGYMYSNDAKAIIDNLAEVNGTDDLKYLTYTNLVVDNINTTVRKRIYTNPRRLEKEETIIFNTPYGRTYYTNKEEKIRDLEVVTSYVQVPTSKTFVGKDGVSNTEKIRMKYYIANDNIKVIHEQSDAIFIHICAILKENCRKFAWGWKSYYWFKEQFADIKYNHAITIHKSQGSTYKTAIINIADVDRNRDMAEKQKLLYTAVTRPSNLLILNNVKE